jgi:uncharacterized protein YchJ
MAHRIYRLSISPEDLPEVRRVVDFDGRCTLADVHDQIAELYGLDDSDHMYAFFTSGRYWDKASAYWDPRTDGARADRALLFRLKLTPGQTCAYLLDFGKEERFTVTVVAASEAAESLPEPLLVESVGEVDASPNLESEPDGEADSDPPELAGLVVLAEAFLDAMDELAELEGEPADAPNQTAPILQAGADAALALLSAVGSDSKRFFQLDDWLLQRSLSVQLLDLPLALAQVAEFERASALARALVFVDRELMQGDLAIVLAKAGRREEALAQLSQNLDQAEDAVLVEAKAGETHRALGDLPAAEAYFRRSLAEAKTSSDRLQALIRVASCLLDQGREAEANEVLKSARAVEDESVQKANPPAVGRNEPCPCGSGKKYKKCHG